MGEAALDAVDIICTVVPGAGAAVAAFFGRAMVAVVLLAMAVGFILRFTRRRSPAAAAVAKLPVWARAIAAGLAAVLVAGLVEATNFPVRFDQPGFEPWHWALVVAALLMAYSFCGKLLGMGIGRRSSSRAIPDRSR